MPMELSDEFRPVVDDLLSRHGLTVDDSTRGMLAETVMHARRRADTRRAYSPAPMAGKALRQARALRRCLDRPPVRANSTSSWRDKLRETICGDRQLYFHLAAELSAERVTAIVDALESGDIDPDLLDALTEALEAIAGRNWRIGRPGGMARKLVRAGCIAWLEAGHPKLAYTWDIHTDAPRGALADFLRDLLASGRQVVSGPTLRSHIDECRKDGTPECLNKNG